MRTLLGMNASRPRVSTSLVDLLERAPRRRVRLQPPVQRCPVVADPMSPAALRELLRRYGVRPAPAGKTNVAGGVQRYGATARAAAAHVERWNPGFRRLLGRVDPSHLGLAIAMKESTFDPTERNEGSGAIGLMQILPSTAAPLLADRRLFADFSRAEFAALSADPERALHRPEVALRVGLAYMSQLLEQHRGDLRLALASYNAGPGNVARHGGVPPFRETRDYVERVPAYARQVAEASGNITS